MTAVHLPSNHSHRDNRSKTKRKIYIYLKIKKEQKKKKYTDTHSISISHLSVVDRKKKEKKKKSTSSVVQSARIISLLTYLVASLDWSAGRKLINEMYCLYRVCFFLTMFYYTHRSPYSIDSLYSLIIQYLCHVCRNYLQSRLYHKAAASFTYDLRDPITVRSGEGKL